MLVCMYMRRTEEEAEATRQALLEAALRLFSSKGYAATGLEEIAAAANVTRGAIYHHFDNKAHLYRTLLQSFAGRFDAQVAAAIEEGGTFLEICRRVMIKPLAYLEQEHDFAAFYELVQFHTVDIPELQEVHQAQMAGVDRMVQTIGGYFQAGIVQGVVRPALDPQHLARTFVALQNGLIHLWLVQQKSFSLTEAAQTAAGLFVAGIAAGTATGTAAGTADPDGAP